MGAVNAHSEWARGEWVRGMHLDAAPACHTNARLAWNWHRTSTRKFKQYAAFAAAKLAATTAYPVHAPVHARPGRRGHQAC
jgi:hypothetical protein